MSVSDRERSLGLNEGYIQNALYAVDRKEDSTGEGNGVSVKDGLFGELREAFTAEFQKGWHWCHKVDEKYHHFNMYNFEFKPIANDPFFAIKMDPPSIVDKKYFYDEETYAKHLIGNTYSVPMIEHLLSPLKVISSDRFYDGYDYKFSWTKH